MASNRIKGITIEIDGDTTKLGKALDGAEKSSRDLQSELKGVESLLKLDPSNVELLRQKQDLLTQSISATEDKLKTLRNAQAQVQAQFERGDITVEQYRDFQREIIATEQKLKRLKDEQKDFGSVVEQQMKVAGKKVEEFGGKIEDAGKKFSILSAGATAGLGYAVKTAGSLEEAVKKVSVATGASKESTEELKEVLKSIHDNNYGEDYNDIAEKMALVKQNLGDISNTDLQNITERAYMLEDAFGMDFNETLRGVNGLISNMGLTAEQAFDYLVVGAQNGLNKSDELADNIAEYSQLWGQAGFSADEMFAILQNGLDSGAYNLDKVNDLVKEMGISLTDGRIEENLSSFSRETQNLFKEWQNGGASQADVIKSIINDFGNMENEQEALTLAGTIWSALGEDNALKVITSLGNVNSTYKDVTGSVTEATDQMYSGTGAKAEKAMKKIQTAFQTMGDAILPILTPIIEKIADLATKFSNLNPTIQKIILVVMSLVAAAGPVLIFIGKIITSVGSIISVLGKLTPLFTLIKTAVSGLFTLIMANPVVAIIVGIIAVIVLLWNKCEWFRDLVTGLFNGLISIFTGIIDFFKNNWQTILLFILNPFAGVFKLLYDKFEGFRNFVDGIVQAIKDIFFAIADWFKTYIIDPIVNFFVGLYESIVAILTPIVEWFTQLFMSIYNTLKSIIEVIIGILKGMWEIIVAIFSVVATWFYNNVIKPVADFFISLWNTISSAAQTCWNFIKGVFNVVANWFNNTIIRPVANFFTGMWNGLKDGAKNAWEGIKNVFGKVADFFGNIFGKAWERVKSIFSTGGKIFSGITEGITKAFTNVVNAIIGGINTVVKIPFDFINGALNKVRNISFLGISPFKDKWKQNPITVPQIPKLKVGTDYVPYDDMPAILHKGEQVVPAKYNPEANESHIKNALFDALTEFSNVRHQNASTGDIGELTRLLKQYMPQIIENMDKDMVLDGRKVGKLIAPTINKELGVISAKEQRGY